MHNRNQLPAVGERDALLAEWADLLRTRSGIDRSGHNYVIEFGDEKYYAQTDDLNECFHDLFVEDISRRIKLVEHRLREIGVVVSVRSADEELRIP